MSREMREQPNVLAAMVDRADLIRASVDGLDPREIELVARGSSDHMATVGRYLLGQHSGAAVYSASPSLVLRDRVTRNRHRQVVIGLSQSGHTQEIADYLLAVRDEGAFTIAITNDEGSPVAAAAELVIALHAGPETAVPATKTVTAQLVALILLCEGLSGTPVAHDRLGGLPEAVANVLRDDGSITPVVETLRAANARLVVARGPLLGAAGETALKLQETTGWIVPAYAAGDLMHGPIAAVGRGVVGLALVDSGPTAPDVRSAVDSMRRLGATVVTVGDASRADVLVPQLGSSALTALLCVVRAQQLALACSLALGRDPDRPAGLSKVTQS